MRLVLCGALVALLAGCAGHVSYVRPTSAASAIDSSATIHKPRDVVWSSAVPALSKQFFVINNLDKSSGLINLSYSGDPERYIDCGRVTSYVKNARGERSYEFAGAKQQESYEVLNNAGLFLVDRRMALEGRINLVFEESGQDATKVTVNTKYVVTRTNTVSVPNGLSRTGTDSVTFNSNTSATFPGNTENPLTCVSTGRLEREIISSIK